MRREKIFNPMDVVGAVGHRRAELPIRNPPMEVVVVKEKDAGKFAGGIEVSPVDSGSAFASVEDKGFKGRV